MSIEHVIKYYFLTFVLTYVWRTDACSMEIYSHCDYQLPQWYLPDNGLYIYGNDFQNDVISSFKAHSNADENCAFYLCNSGLDSSSLQYGNECYYDSATDGETPQLPCATTIGMNDVISSILIREESPVCQVELFSADLYGGKFAGPLGIGRYTLAQLLSRGVTNDDISSMKVTAAAGVSCVIELYEADNFANTHGRAVIPIPRNTKRTEHKFSLATLKRYGFVNDALSSMVVTIKETIKDVTWNIDGMKLLTAVPESMGSINYDYEHSGSGGLWEETLTKTETKSWQVSYEHSVGAEVTWEVEFGSPFIGLSSSLSVSISYQFTISKSNAGKSTEEYSQRVVKTILPGQVGRCEWTMKKVNLNIPFTAVINKIDDFGVYTEEVVGGVWNGVGYHDSSLVCADTKLPDICQNAN
eukprot:290325_1